MAEPTPNQVLAFYEAMKARYRSVVVNKQSAAEMRIITWFLGVMGVIDKDKFLNRYATTLGRRIYLPFTPGVASRGRSLWGQMVLFVHENMHVQQYGRNPWKFVTDYADSAKRTAIEVEAYATNLELHYWHTGVVPNPVNMIQTLRNYGVHASDIKVAETKMIALARRVKAGGVRTDAGKFAVKWLETHAPDLKHV